MMLPSPRIIAIDDEPKHLDGLAKSLNQYGAACLRIHFTGDITAIKACPHVRVIFADLHLQESGAASDHAQHFGLIGSLIEGTITPSGPYVLILWTKYPDQANALQQFLEQRLEGVSKPLSVVAIDKMTHLSPDGDVKSIEDLVAAIVSIISRQPQIAAVLNWEERVLGAAADTVSSLVKLAESVAAPAGCATELGRLLARLAVEGVGQEHVERDRFHAVNEALLPILADRIAALRSRDGDVEIWKNAFSNEDVHGALSLDEASKLNRLLHVAPATDANTGAERGAVIPLPDAMSGERFEETFSLSPQTAVETQFFGSGYVAGDAQFRWVLLQSQAACDYAQRQPGPLPFYLGLDMEVSKAKKGTPPAALWTSPPFELEGKVRLLRVNARFQVSLPLNSAEAVKPIYRLRDQLLADLINHVHTYSARPGMISFRERKAKQQAAVVQPKPNGAAGP